MPPSLPPEQQRILDRFPPALRDPVIADATHFVFLPTAPHPQLSQPDMDAIRNASNCEAPAPMPDVLQAPGTIEMDIRGELPIYHEAHRRTDVIRTWSKGNHFYRSSLTSWWFTEEHRSVPIMEEEKKTILETFVHCGRIHLGNNIHVVDR